MPQPLRTLGKVTLIQGIACVEDTSPELAQLVGQIIGACSTMEVEQTKLVTSCLGAEYLTALDLLNALEQNPAGRRKAIDAIVESRFRSAPDDRHLVERVLKRVRSANKIRAALAHYTWARVHDRPDILVLVPPSDAVTRHGVIRDMTERGEYASGPFGRRVFGADAETSKRLGRAWDDLERRGIIPMYYTESELHAYVQEIKQTCLYLRWAEEIAARDQDRAVKARAQLTNALSDSS